MIPNLSAAIKYIIPPIQEYKKHIKQLTILELCSTGMKIFNINKTIIITKQENNVFSKTINVSLYSM